MELQLQFEKHGGTEGTPNWRAMLRGSGEELEVAAVARGHAETELGPVPCWFVKGRVKSAKFRRLRDAKAHVARALMDALVERFGTPDPRIDEHESRVQGAGSGG